VKIGEFEVEITPSKCPSPRFSISVEARAPYDFKGVIEVLALRYPPSKVTYSRESRSVTLRIFDRLIGVYESGVIAFCAENLEEARKILEKLKAVIEEARREKPVSWSEAEKWTRISTLKLYSFLPKTNCGKCGEATCIALAAKVLAGDRRLSDCPLLKRSEYKSLIENFRSKYGDRILAALGWP